MYTLFWKSSLSRSLSRTDGVAAGEERVHVLVLVRVRTETVLLTSPLVLALIRRVDLVFVVALPLLVVREDLVRLSHLLKFIFTTTFIYYCSLFTIVFTTGFCRDGIPSTASCNSS